MTVNVSVWWEECPEGKKFIIFSVPKNFGINSEFVPNPSKTISFLSGIHIHLRNHIPLKNTEAWSRRSRPKIIKCVGFYPPRLAHLCCQCIETGNTILLSCGRLTYNFTSVCKYTDTQHAECILIISAVVHFHTIKHNYRDNPLVTKCVHSIIEYKKTMCSARSHHEVKLCCYSSLAAEQVAS
jgi:hypothetical protein